MFRGLGFRGHGTIFPKFHAKRDRKEAGRSGSAAKLALDGPCPLNWLRPAEVAFEVSIEMSSPDMEHQLMRLAETIAFGASCTCAD
jgi:hypothetical protein